MTFLDSEAFDNVTFTILMYVYIKELEKEELQCNQKQRRPKSTECSKKALWGLAINNRGEEKVIWTVLLSSRHIIKL